MNHWSRRRFLASFGAAGAAVTSGWIGACGPVTGPGRLSRSPSVDDELRRVLENLSDPLKNAFVWSRRERIHTISVDSSEENADQRFAHWVVLGGVADVPRSIALLNPSARELARAATELGATKRSKGGFALPERVEDVSRLGSARVPYSSELRKRTLELYRKSESFKSSRIVFRSAFLRIQDTECLLLSENQHRFTQSIRSRAGVLLAAWTGEDIADAEVGASQVGVPSEIPISEQSLEQLAGDVLGQTHARFGVKPGIVEVILSPDCVAELTLRAIAMPSCSSQAPTLKPTQMLRVVDDPSIGYAGYSRDDFGDEPTTTVLLRDQVGSKLGSGRQRRDQNARIRCFPSSVVVGPGVSTSQVSKQQLIASVTSGVLLERPLQCTVDPQSQRLTLVSSRGREIQSGRFTGRVFAKQVMSVTLSALIADTKALASNPKTFSFELDGAPMSIQCSYWLSRAHLEPV